MIPRQLPFHGRRKFPQPLIEVMLEIGAHRITFSTNHQFEVVWMQAEWFDATPISRGERSRAGRRNAIRLFKLP